MRRCRRTLCRCEATLARLCACWRQMLKLDLACCTEAAVAPQHTRLPRSLTPSTGNPGVHRPGAAAARAAGCAGGGAGGGAAGARRLGGEEVSWAGCAWVRCVDVMCSCCCNWAGSVLIATALLHISALSASFGPMHPCCATLFGAGLRCSGCTRRTSRWAEVPFWLAYLLAGLMCTWHPNGGSALRLEHPCTYVIPLTVLCPCCLNPSCVVPGLLSRGVAAPGRGALLLPPQPPRPAVAWAAARCRHHGVCACGLSKQPFAAACVWGDSD